MSATVLAVGVIIAAIAMFAMWIYRGRAMKAPIPIGTLALVLILGLGVVSHDQAQTADKAHSDCVSRVERAQGNRTMWIALGDYLSDHGNPTAARVLNDLVDKNLPLLQLKDCP